MAKETTLTEGGQMLTHVVEHMATKEDVAKLDTRIDDLRVEMIDQFEHVDKQLPYDVATSAPQSLIAR
jgi:hypothetical protein